MRLFVKFIIISGLCGLAACGGMNGELNRAMELANKGDFNGALRIYRQILKEKPEHPLYLNNFGWTLFKADSLEYSGIVLKKAFQNAEGSQLKEYIQKNRNMTRAFLTGQRFLKNENAKEALNEFLKITEKNKVKDIGYKYLALTYEALGNIEIAKANWEQIITAYENSRVRNHFYKLAREKILNYAQHAITVGNYEEAIRIYRILTTVEKDSAEGNNYLGYALFLNDELIEGKEILEKARDKDSHQAFHDSIQTNLFMVTTFLAGEYSLSRENYKSALNEFRKVTERYPEMDIGLKYMALCYEGMNEKQKADELLQRIAFLHEGNKHKNKYYHFAVAKLKLEIE